MTRIEQKKEQKREAILRAAWEAFLSEGYLGAGMDRIAKEAGVTKQTVYRYFESKEQLFQACLESRREDSGSEFLKELDREDTRIALSRFASGFLARHMSGEHLAAVRLLIAEGPDAPELTRAFYAVGPHETRTRLARFIDERLHAEDTEYAVRMLLDTLLSMRMGILVGLHAPPSSEEIAEHAERTVRQFMKLFS